MSSIRGKNEALKKLHFKSIMKCFKSENRQVTGFTIHSIPPIDCCVRINHKPDILLNCDIQS